MFSLSLYLLKKIIYNTIFLSTIMVFFYISQCFFVAISFLTFSFSFFQVSFFLSVTMKLKPPQRVYANSYALHKTRNSQ